jgi:phage portal protein BeeE
MAEGRQRQGGSANGGGLDETTAGQIHDAHSIVIVLSKTVY